MSTTRSLALVLLLCACAHSPVFPPAADGTPREHGRWITASGNLEVDLAPCEDAKARLCGTVTRVLANRSMERPGEEMQSIDGASPLGMKILIDFEPAGGGDWEGKIYNRENGKTYSCAMNLQSPDELKLRAYKLMHLFGKTQMWRRSPD